MVAQSGDHPENSHGSHAPVPRREVVCFDCKAVSKASAKATSTQCSNCGTFIDLRDVDIRQRSTQRIRTRGNVTVHKKGALLGTAVHCGSLVIEGSVAGSIYAQETVEFRTHAKVLGEIRCRHLVVEKRCQVQCLQPVHVQSMSLQGRLTARVLASGLVQIGRQGRLEGGTAQPGVRRTGGWRHDDHRPDSGGGPCGFAGSLRASFKIPSRRIAWDRSVIRVH